MNLEAYALPGFTDEQMKAITQIYEEEVKPLVHQLW